MKVWRSDHDEALVVVVPPKLPPQERLPPERVVVPDGGVCDVPLVVVTLPPEAPPWLPH